MADARLNSLGQLVSDVDLTLNHDKPPIDVKNNTNLVVNLNADTVDGIQGDQLLRTDAARTLLSTLTVGDTGTIQVSGAGKVRIGNFSLKQVDNVLSFSYEA